MRYLRRSLSLRYVAAILLTTALMIWISVNEEGAGPAVPGQVLFWSAAVGAGWLQMILIARGVRASFGTERWPGWVLLVATALIGAVPISFEVRWLLETILAPEAGLPPPWLTYVNVTVINTVFCGVQYLLIERWPLFDEAAPAPVSTPVHGPSTSDTDAPMRPAIGRLGRPPEGLSGEIRYMKMEDHYLHVTTDEGRGMTLHRLSGACRELDGTGGLQVHRSWWVARGAVRGVRQENRRRIITAVDGTEIPVGRSYEAKLREAGWF